MAKYKKFTEISIFSMLVENLVRNDVTYDMALICEYFPYEVITKFFFFTWSACLGHNLFI